MIKIVLQTLGRVEFIKIKRFYTSLEMIIKEEGRRIIK